MSSRPRPAPPPRPQANGCGPRLLEDGRRRLGAYNCRGARAAEGAEVGLWAYPASRLRRGRDTAGAGDRFRTEPQTQCRTSNTPSKTVSQQYVTRVLERDRHPLNRTRTTRYEAWTYFMRDVLRAHTHVVCGVWRGCRLPARARARCGLRACRRTPNRNRKNKKGPIFLSAAKSSARVRGEPGVVPGSTRARDLREESHSSFELRNIDFR